MIDPTFINRADLEAWAVKAAAVPKTGKQQLTVLAILRRVTLAHAHLLNKRKDDA